LSGRAPLDCPAECGVRFAERPGGGSTARFPVVLLWYRLRPNAEGLPELAHTKRSPKLPVLPVGGRGHRFSDVRSALHASLVPVLLLVSGTTNRCQLSTDSGTGELHLSGTVHFLRVETGCWQLEAESGRHYELKPDQAPASLLRDGARVSVVGQPAEGSATGCRVGMPIDVRRVVSVEVG
jgi:hypothetical protein